MKKEFYRVKLFDWFDNSSHNIVVKALDGEGDYHYTIYVDNSFWCTAEMCSEVYEEICDIIKLYDWKLIPLI